MTGEIINRVANSNLVTIDLTDYAPKSAIKILDIKDFLFEGVFLKERNIFRKPWSAARPRRKRLHFTKATKSRSAYKIN